MARSNSTSFTLTKNQILTMSWQMGNLYEDQEVPEYTALNFASNVLNCMIKSWQADGIQLWNRKQATLFPQILVNNYKLGPAGDNITNAYISTYTGLATAVNATTIYLNGTDGMSIGDNIGIEMDNGIRFWSTITAINTGLRTVTIASGLTYTAALGLTVVTYTSKIIGRPLRVIRATSMDITTTNAAEVTMANISYNKYFDIPNKNMTGNANNFYYDKQLDSGVLYVYPTPSQVSRVINMTYHEPLEDALNANDNLDFPTEWLLAIIVNLTYWLLMSRGKMIEAQSFKQDAVGLKDAVRNFDSDEEPLTLSVG